MGRLARLPGLLHRRFGVARRLLTEADRAGLVRAAGPFHEDVGPAWWKLIGIW